MPSKGIWCSSPSNLASITRKWSQIAQNDLLLSYLGTAWAHDLGFESLLEFSFAACYNLSAPKLFFLGTLASIPPLKSSLFAMLRWREACLMTAAFVNSEVAFLSLISCAQWWLNEKLDTPYPDCCMNNLKLSGGMPFSSFPVQVPL